MPVGALDGGGGRALGLGSIWAHTEPSSDNLVCHILGPLIPLKTMISVR